MSLRYTSFVEGEYYHVYNRGNSKQAIFHDNDDMQRFQDLLYITNNPERIDVRNIQRNKNNFSVPLCEGKTSTKKIPNVLEVVRRQDLRSSEGLAFASKNPSNIDLPSKLVAIGSYCIMPNHFHILITPFMDGGVSKFMQKLSTAYSMYYNKKYSHSGGLFEGKFKAKHVPDDRYLKYLFSYINLNPVKLIDSTWKQYGIKDVEKTFKFLENYKYSSYLDLLSCEGKTFVDNNKERSDVDILSLEAFPEYFPQAKGSTFKKEIMIWFSYRDNF